MENRTAYPEAKKYLMELDAQRGKLKELMSKKCAFSMSGKTENAERTEREIACAEEKLRALGRSIGSLPSGGRKTLLELRYVYGLPPAVVRRSMGLSERGYYSALRRAMAFMEKKMGEDADA